MKFLVVLLMVVLSTESFSQNEDVDYIRNLYKRVSEQIRLCNESETCYLYQNNLNFNTLGGEWRAVGNYSKKIIFWYTDDPTHCDECGQEGMDVLKKIEIEEISGLYPYHYELLFDKGNLVFYFLRGESEYRYYFRNSTLIRYMEGQQISTDFDDSTIQNLKHHSQKLKGLFRESF
jgi:hypothetical protein